MNINWQPPRNDFGDGADPHPEQHQFWRLLAKIVEAKGAAMVCSADQEIPEGHKIYKIMLGSEIVGFFTGAITLDDSNAIRHEFFDHPELGESLGGRGSLNATLDEVRQHFELQAWRQQGLAGAVSPDEEVTLASESADDDLPKLNSSNLPPISLHKQLPTDVEASIGSATVRMVHPPCATKEEILKVREGMTESATGPTQTSWTGLYLFENELPPMVVNFSPFAEKLPEGAPINSRLMSFFLEQVGVSITFEGKSSVNLMDSDTFFAVAAGVVEVLKQFRQSNREPELSTYAACSGKSENYFLIVLKDSEVMAASSIDGSSIYKFTAMRANSYVPQMASRTFYLLYESIQKSFDVSIEIGHAVLTDEQDFAPMITVALGRAARAYALGYTYGGEFVLEEQTPPIPGPIAGA